MKHKRKILFYVFVIISVAGFFYWKMQPPKGNTQKSKAIPIVETSRVLKKDISENIELTGEVVAVNRVTLKTTVTGIISYSPFREGDMVEAGEILVKISRPLLLAEMKLKEAALKVAKAKLDDLKYGSRPEEIQVAQHIVDRYIALEAYTRKDFERNKKLSQKGAISREDFEAAELEYIKAKNEMFAAKEKLNLLKEGARKTEIAVLEAQVKEKEAELTMLKEKVLECEIRSPFKGVVTKIFAQKGDLVQENRDNNSSIMEILDTSSIVVLFHVPLQYAHLIKKNENIYVLVDSFNGEYIESKITRIYPEIDKTTHTLAVESSISGNGILPGMFARVKLSLQSANNTVVIPENSLLTDLNDNHFVFIFKNGSVEKRMVKPGIESGSFVQIVQGLIHGDIVITSGNENLKNGMKVKVKNVEKKLPALSGNNGLKEK